MLNTINSILNGFLYFYHGIFGRQPLSTGIRAVARIRIIASKLIPCLLYVNSRDLIFFGIAINLNELMAIVFRQTGRCNLPLEKVIGPNLICQNNGHNQYHHDQHGLQGQRAG